MNENLKTRITNKILQSDYATPRTKINNGYIRYLRCPVCGDETAYAHERAPWVIICNRANHCGSRTKILNLFPDILINFEREYEPTEDDPQRPAREFLRARGMESTLEGLGFEYIPRTRSGCGGGVGFRLLPWGADAPAPNPVVWNVRLFNPPMGEGKTHNKGSLDDGFWFHPAFPYDLEKEIFITEGVIDALSLLEMGRQAIAVISSSRNPDNVQLPGLKKPVLAFDNDRAGRDAFRRWKTRYPEAGAITPDDGDWNDLLVGAGSATAAREALDRRAGDFRCLGELMTAASAKEYAEKYRGHFNRNAGLFDFDGETYFADENSGETKCRKVGNFTVSVDHFRYDTHNPDQPEYQYRLRIRPRGGRERVFTVRGCDLSTPDALTKVLLTHGKCAWTGDKKPSQALMRKIVASKSPDVRQLDVIGHDIATGYYVFPSFAVDKKGNLMHPDKRGFYELSSLKVIRAAPLPSITPQPGMSAREIYLAVKAAWGPRGEIGMAWMVGAWLVNVIKETVGFYPFLSFYGEPASGKTVLIETLNSMETLDEEGLTMSRENTGKGELRKLGQISGMFRALLEGNREKVIRFDFDKLLTLYNRNPLQVRAVKSNDNQVVTMEFKAALALVQNVEPLKSPAQKSRAISVGFRLADIADTHEAFERAKRIRKNQYANFFPDVMRHRAKLEEGWEARFREISRELETEIPNPRIRENHALVLTFHELLCGILDVECTLRPYILGLAQAKMKSCYEHEESIADYFFDALEQLSEGEKGQCAILDDEGRLHVRLATAVKLLQEEKFTGYRVSEIQEALRSHPSYLNSRHSSRQFTPTTKVWLFNNAKIVGVGEDEEEGDNGSGDPDGLGVGDMGLNGEEGEEIQEKLDFEMEGENA